MNQEIRQEIPRDQSFHLDNILIKNLSLEMPQDIVTPTFGNEPSIQLELRNNARALSRKNCSEVVLEATVKVNNDNKIQLLLEVSLSGIFFIDQPDAQRRQEVINIHAPELLYPYLSHLISDLMMRAGAPRMFLPPFNFRNVYERKQQFMKEKLAQDAGSDKMVT